MISKTLFSHYQQTLKLGIPISIGQIGTIVLSFADTMMVGRYDTPSLAAASFVNSVFNLVIFLLIGYSFGLTPQVGALFGQGETASVGAAVRQALRANSLFAALLMLIMGVGYFFVDRMGQPESLLPLIRPYYLVILASMPFVMLFNVLRQLSDGTMHTKTAMWALWAGNALNILGNWLLIYGVGPFPELGLLGAGLSTLLSRPLRLVCTAPHQCAIFARLYPDGSRDSCVYVLRRDGRMDWKSRVGGLPSDHDGEHIGLYVLL